MRNIGKASATIGNPEQPRVSLGLLQVFPVKMSSQTKNYKAGKEFNQTLLYYYWLNCKVNGRKSIQATMGKSNLMITLKQGNKRIYKARIEPYLFYF